MTHPARFFVVLLVMPLVAGAAHAHFAGEGAPPKVDLAVHEKEQRVDITFDGRPFTSYTWAANLKKPLLWPIRTAEGSLITRGFPVAPRPDEATDHPHHLGLWLNYGNVNGIDFWNNSEQRKPGGKMGTVVHRKVKAAKSGKGQAALDVAADWVGPDGAVMLAEQTGYVFSGGSDRRVIDRTTSLLAAAGPVSLPDNKEGIFGLRLARELEHPGDKNPAGTGRYRSSEGIEGKEVWGTRGRWMMLSAQLDKRPVTVVMLDHPGNPGHPTYWHARPWGLFAANNLGQKQLSKDKETLNYSLPKGQTARFRYRVLIVSRAMTPAEVETEYRSFVGK